MLISTTLFFSLYDQETTYPTESWRNMKGREGTFPAEGLGEGGVLTMGLISAITIINNSSQVIIPGFIDL